jgi:hypothetical protein
MLLLNGFIIKLTAFNEHSLYYYLQVNFKYIKKFILLSACPNLTKDIK